MLGLQETRPSGTPSAKTYSCVACSATFNGLASLLVHQASHANEIPNQPVTSLPTCSHCGGLFASKELLEKHHCMVLPPPVNQDVHLAEFEEEFREFSTIQERKRSQDVEMQVDQKSDETAADLTKENTETEPRPDSNRSSAEVPSHLNSHCLSPEGSLQVPSPSVDCEPDDCVISFDIPTVHNDSSQEQDYEDIKAVAGTSPSNVAEDEDLESFEQDAENLKSDIVTRCISDSEEPDEKAQEPEPNDKKTLLKILASAYMNRKQVAQIKWGQSKRSLPPRKVSPRAPIQSSKVVSPSNNRYRVSHLRLKIAKYGSNKEGFMPTGSMLQLKLTNLPKKGSIVSVTKALCPVVMLETRQKLAKDNVEGQHQCGLCRRVFPDMDSLIMHHVLHRKERVKFCRRCQQLVISVIAVPDNHVCSRSSVATPKPFPFVKQLISTSNDPVTPHMRKLFHCKLCNRSYTRRHNLNRHNCQWIASLKSAASAATKDYRFGSFVEGFDSGEKGVSGGQKPTGQVNVGVNTLDVSLIKEEDLSVESSLEEQHLALKSKAQLGFIRSFPPFLSKTSNISALQQDEAANMDKASASQADVSLENEANNSAGSGQWTVPLDGSEIDVLLEADDEIPEGDEPPRENSDEDVEVIEPSFPSQATSAFSSKDYQIQVSESGIRRFTCNRCQRSYSRRFTLNNHLKICGARKVMVQHTFAKASANSLCPNKKFPCPICGTAFTRKDNMKIHYKRCQSMRNKTTGEENKVLEKQNPASRENIFVLPPIDKQARNKNNNNAAGGVGGGSWGIMSLPTVLPRKVTCECGAAFTCPRLLFEHLQIHAMESYICSHCGENLRSWAEFEVHQKLHTDPAAQKVGQNEPRQQQIYAQPQQKLHFQPADQKQIQDLLKSRCVCPRCKKTFMRRKSMLRHLRLSCRGDAGVPKKNSCTRCGMAFLNPLALKVHVQANTCAPAFKPVRCPVCVRWFSCLEGLKRHLIVHSQQKHTTCQICGHNFPNQQALEEHKKNAHAVNNRASSEPAVQSTHTVPTSLSSGLRCQICQRSYPKLQSLKDHLRKVHGPKGPKPVGVFGDKGEAQQSQYGTVQQGLSKHFQCQICGLTFSDIGTLKNHKRRVHHILGGGDCLSQFQCQICSRSYPNLRSLRNHRRRVHRILGGLEASKGIFHQNPDNIYKCQICQRSYPCVKSLKNHRRRVHRILGGVFEATKMTLQPRSESHLEIFHVPATSKSLETITVVP